MKDCKLIVSHEFPPIPTRNYDWVCYIEGQEERKHYGYGTLPNEAVKDFLEQYGEDLNSK